MNPRFFAARALLLLIAAAPAVDAAVVTVEPDFFPLDSDLSTVGPGLTLMTIRRKPDAFAPMAQPVLAVEWAWPAVGDAPTGIQLFGHPPSAPAAHWAGLNNVLPCLRGFDCRPNFYVFVAVFDTKTSFVEIKTAMVPWAIDGAELWAYDSLNRRIEECSIPGIDHRVLLTGVLPDPTYGTRLLPPRVPRHVCGKVTRRSFCEPGGDPGDCRFDVTAWIRRPARDIAYVMWGGVNSSDSTSPVDALRYEF